MRYLPACFGLGLAVAISAGAQAQTAAAAPEVFPVDQQRVDTTPRAPHEISDKFSGYTAHDHDAAQLNRQVLMNLQEVDRQNAEAIARAQTAYLPPPVYYAPTGPVYPAFPPPPPPGYVPAGPVYVPR